MITPRRSSLLPSGTTDAAVDLCGTRQRPHPCHRLDVVRVALRLVVAERADVGRRDHQPAAVESDVEPPRRRDALPEEPGQHDERELRRRPAPRPGRRATHRPRPPPMFAAAPSRSGRAGATREARRAGSTPDRQVATAISSAATGPHLPTDVERGREVVVGDERPESEQAVAQPHRQEQADAPLRRRSRPGFLPATDGQSRLATRRAPCGRRSPPRDR